MYTTEPLILTEIRPNTQVLGRHSATVETFVNWRELAYRALQNLDREQREEVFKEVNAFMEKREALRAGHAT